MAFRRITGVWAALAGGLVAATLAGCGQKGDLYMPDQPPPWQQNTSDCRTPSCAAATSAPEDNNAEAATDSEPALQSGSENPEEKPPEETSE